MTRSTRIAGVKVAGLVTVAFLASIVTVVTQESAEPQPWLHVQIENGASADRDVGINLPLRAAVAVLSMAPNTVVADGHLEVGPEYGVSVSGLREVWRELRDAGDAEFVTVQHGPSSVRIGRVGERVEIRVTETAKNERVEADVPVAVVDALLSGEGETVNIDAALETLDTLRGDVVRVTDHDRRIRVWVDENPVQ